MLSPISPDVLVVAAARDSVWPTVFSGTGFSLRVLTLARPTQATTGQTIGIAIRAEPAVFRIRIPQAEACATGPSIKAVKVCASVMEFGKQLCGMEANCGGGQWAFGFGDG
jgi:hypothetical protein